MFYSILAEILSKSGLSCLKKSNWVNSVDDSIPISRGYSLNGQNSYCNPFKNLLGISCRIKMDNRNSQHDTEMRAVKNLPSDYRKKLHRLICRPCSLIPKSAATAILALLTAVCMEGGMVARADEVSINWQLGSTGKILFDNKSESYPAQIARVQDDFFGGVSRESVVEKLGNRTINHIRGISRFGGNFVDVNQTPGFKGKEYRGKVKYGSWYSSADYDSQNLSCPVSYCINVMFRPNAAVINTLKPGEVVYETYTYTPFQKGEEMATKEITVVIMGKQ